MTCTGPGGCGKTHLALEVATRLTGNFQDGVYFVSLAPLRDPKLVLFTIPPLGLPTNTISVEEGEDYEKALSEYPATYLFIERARAIIPDFKIIETTGPQIVEICKSLDGLPLAIELSVPLLRLMTIDAMVAKMDHRLSLLTLGARDLPRRLQSLKNTIDWSYDLLDAAEKSLFHHLSVFAGGSYLNAISEICSIEESNLLPRINSLVEKNLLSLNERNGSIRFSMLETIREYSSEKLDGSGETDELLRAHAGFFLQLVQHNAPKLFGHDQLASLQTLRDEIDNVRAAFLWHKQNNLEIALSMATNLWTFWLMTGRMTEALEWLEDLLIMEGNASPSMRIRATSFAVFFSSLQDKRDAADAHMNVISQLLPAEHDPECHAIIGYCTGFLPYVRGEFAEAATVWERGLPYAREAHHGYFTANTLRALGIAVNRLGDYERAVSLFEESLEISRSMGDRWSSAYVLRNWGLIALYRGDYEEVPSLCEESFRISLEYGDKWSLAWGLEVLATALIHGWEKARIAVRLFGAAHNLRQDIGAPVPQSDRVMFGNAFEKAKNTLDDRTFNNEWRIGRLTPLSRFLELIAGVKNVAV